ncbi:transcriptional regulator, BadM/Rrf2 family [Thermobaculum terrenum ATCC BAA-798]|uniref:Transcriptional regulator, BadM/Rrf2 family n=1 Tax=Thermobaculum terrenum (strain ATCC BAA-798 / CCMEE 7001 / YNP1) TaxID=525904 RepID=D1CHA0_THET1|nr:Rrf2 family transcriptional regulator [Thermobaculum terrenum]ACZ43121.1 transcriptional regulator, BadM/Rrf2 family [Thermobaculum terrenum ATCC BAA-798]
MHITARADYALRAAIEMAASWPQPLKGEQISEAQDIPIKFLESILLDLKRAGLVRTQRGQAGGYWLGREPAEISLADIIRAVEGPLANVRGMSPEEITYKGRAATLRDVWVALRANMRAVLETTTLAHMVRGELPEQLHPLLQDPDAWVRRGR